MTPGEAVVHAGLNAPTGLARGDCMNFDRNMADACAATGEESIEFLVAAAAAAATADT